MTQTSATADTLPSPPPRPLWMDTRITAKVCEAMWPRLLDWITSSEGGSAFDATDIEDMRESANKILTVNAQETNGYKLAKEFEADYWEPDAALVEVLSGVLSERMDARYALVKEWVKEYKILTSWVVGDKVLFDHPDHCTGEVTGTVVRVYPEEARVVVNCPSLGHKTSKRGLEEGLYVDAECLSLAPCPVAG